MNQYTVRKDPHNPGKFALYLKSAIGKLHYIAGSFGTREEAWKRADKVHYNESIVEKQIFKPIKLSSLITLYEFGPINPVHGWRSNFIRPSNLNVKLNNAIVAWSDYDDHRGTVIHWYKIDSTKLASNLALAKIKEFYRNDPMMKFQITDTIGPEYILRIEYPDSSG